MEQNVETHVCEACGQRPATIGPPVRCQRVCGYCYTPALARSQSCCEPTVWAGHYMFQQRKLTLQSTFDALEQYCDLLSSTVTQVTKQLDLYQHYKYELSQVLNFSYGNAQSCSYGADLRSTATRFLLGTEGFDSLEFHVGISPEALTSSILMLCRTSWGVQPPKKCSWCPNLVSRFPFTVPAHMMPHENYAREVCSQTCLGKYSSICQVRCLGCSEFVTSIQASTPRYPCGHFFFHNKHCIFDSFKRYSRTFRMLPALPCGKCKRSYGPEELREYLSEPEYSEQVKQVRDSVCCVCDSQQLCWALRCGHWLCAQHEGDQDLKCGFCNEAVMHYSSPKARQWALSYMQQSYYADDTSATLTTQVHPSLQAAKDHVRFVAEKWVQLDHPSIRATYGCFLILGPQPTSGMLCEPFEEDFQAALMTQKDRKEAWPEKQLLLWLCSFLDALNYAREHQLSHGDLKLEHMLLGRSGQPMLFAFQTQYSAEAQDKDIRDLGVAFEKLSRMELRVADGETAPLMYEQLSAVLTTVIQRDPQCDLSFAKLKDSCQQRLTKCMMCMADFIDESWASTVPQDLKPMMQQGKLELCSLRCARHLFLSLKYGPSVMCTGVCCKRKNEPITDKLSSPPTVSLACGHPFHNLTCLEESLREYLSCPQCCYLPDREEVNALLGDGFFESLQAEMCTRCLRGKVCYRFGLCEHALCVRCHRKSFFFGNNCKQCRESP